MNIEEIIRYKWLKHAAKQIYEYGQPTDKDISEFVDLCKKEAIGESITDVHFQDFHDPVQNDNNGLRLLSISGIEGVNSLVPGKSLEFKEGCDITVVYGFNGSGKSSYVRLLKHVCDAHIKGELLPNVYKYKSNNQQAQEAKITFKKDGKQSCIDWVASKNCEQLTSVNIFDHTYGEVLDKDFEVSYEPPKLSFITSLIKVCDRVGGELSAEIQQHQQKIPLIPREHEHSKEAEWLKKINAQIPDTELEQYCVFNDKDKKRLEGLNFPKDKIENLEKKKQAIKALLNDVQKHLQQLSDEAYKRVISLRKTYIYKKNVADVAAKKEFKDIPLEGVGLDTWKGLWNAARKYSMEKAYKGRTFPVVEIEDEDEDAVCVLCHQSLSKSAQDRFNEFEDYVQGSTLGEANKAHKAWQAALEKIDDISDEETLVKNIGDAGMIENDHVKKSLLSLYVSLRARKEKLSVLNSESETPVIPNGQCVEDIIKRISNKYEVDIEKCSQKTPEADKELASLNARKWFSENRAAVEEEIKHRQCIGKIQKAKDLTDTTSLSKRKGKIFGERITKEFVEQFNEELKALNASEVKAEIEQGPTKKGGIQYKLVLRGASEYSPKTVLSEGEKRVVSIAAFLADIGLKELRAPVVFDDPASSLDQKFEQAFAERLCELSSSRQVIIFTHRLPMLSLLRSRKQGGVKMKVDLSYIEREGEKSGIPTPTPFNILSTKKALSKFTVITNERPRDAMSREFRILLERMIEYDLLSRIVMRDNARIYTSSIHKLLRIKKPHIEMFDKFLKKYHPRMHSSSPETAAPLPEYDELKRDAIELEQWRSGFTDRQKKFNQKK